MKILTHVMEGYENLVGVKDVKAALKLAKSRVQEVLMPRKIPGGSMEDRVSLYAKSLAFDFAHEICHSNV